MIVAIHMGQMRIEIEYLPLRICLREVIEELKDITTGMKITLFYLSQIEFFLLIG